MPKPERASMQMDVKMITRLIAIDPVSPEYALLEEAGELLRSGGLCAIPTETVYGLAANALNEQAVAGIFAAKGRPQDNPLIVHIADSEGLAPLTAEIPKEAQVLARAFWPGPLTMILPRSALVPSIVSAGLDTVAVRMPSHPVARALIRAAGVPLAAPSANLSGSPSPTTAAHVYDDLKGRIPMIIDGGACSVGLESTVISLVGEPSLLRPGGITKEELERVIGAVRVDSGVLHRVADTAKAASPGMKYKHYAPKAKIIMIEAASDAFCEYANKNNGIFALCFAEDTARLTTDYVEYGSAFDAASQANRLFDALRELDRRGARMVYAHAPKPEGVGLAVYNRLLRAAGFEKISLQNHCGQP